MFSSSRTDNEYLAKVIGDLGNYLGDKLDQIISATQNKGTATPTVPSEWVIASNLADTLLRIGYVARRSDAQFQIVRQSLTVNPSESKQLTWTPLQDRVLRIISGITIATDLHTTGLTATFIVDGNTLFSADLGYDLPISSEFIPEARQQYQLTVTSSATSSVTVSVDMVLAHVSMDFENRVLLPIATRLYQQILTIAGQ